MSDQELIQKVALLKRLAWLALAGVIAAGVLAIATDEPSAWPSVGILWGGILVLETGSERL